MSLPKGGGGEGGRDFSEAECLLASSVQKMNL